MWSRTGTLFISLMLLAGCGEEGEQGAWEEPDCPAPDEIVRVDCPYPEGTLEQVEIRQPKDFEPICQSPCKQVWKQLVLEGERTYSLAPLSYVDEIGGLYIRHKSLPNLKGLENVKKIRVISVTGSGLINFEGLENVESTVDLLVQGNPKLQSFKGFEGLVEVEGGAQGINVSDNPKLEKVGSFDKLKSSFLGISFYNNTNLKEVDGFRSLDHDRTTLAFEFNENLTKLTGLEQVKMVNYLTFTDNFKLTQCEILRVYNAIPTVNNFVNRNNGPEGPCPE